jgi:hypothetical protein
VFLNRLKFTVYFESANTKQLILIEVNVGKIGSHAWADTHFALCPGTVGEQVLKSS